jgi:hypothetical protein
MTRCHGCVPQRDQIQDVVMQVPFMMLSEYGTALAVLPTRGAKPQCAVRCSDAVPYDTQFEGCLATQLVITVQS